jgi:hypothetical protein
MRIETEGHGLLERLKRIEREALIKYTELSIELADSR